MMFSLAFVLAWMFQGAPSGRTAEITGRVLLQDGTPAPGVRVSALEVNDASPGQSLQVSLAETDDVGRYRLTNVPPGRYYIQAGASGMPTYYPGVFDRSYALIVTVSGGGQSPSIDFAMAEPVPPVSPSRARANQDPCNPGFVNPPVSRPPLILAADRAGNVFFAEVYSNVVRKISPDGKVAVVAGNGLGGHDGDGGPAIAAALGPVNALATDPQGDLFIAEGSFVAQQRAVQAQAAAGPPPAPRIRKVTPSGTITTVAGNGAVGRGGDGGPATSASLCPTTTLATDGLGNLFIGADPGPGYRDFVVRKVNPAGVISLVPESVIYRPDPAPNGIFIGVLRMHVAADAAGNVFIIGNGQIQRIAVAGRATTLATVDRTGVDSGVAMDGSGNLFLADSGYLQRNQNNAQRTGTVQKLTPSGVLTTVAGDGGSNPVEEGVPAVSASLRFAQPPTYDRGSALAADGAGNLYLAESDRIRKITPEGAISTLTTLNRSANSFRLQVKLASAIAPEAYAEIGFSGRQEPADPVALLYLLRTDGISRQMQLFRGSSLNPPMNGEFEIPKLAPGVYELFASLPDIRGWGAVGSSGTFLAPRSFGRKSIVVLEDGANVTVTVHPGVDVKGQVFLDGRPASPAGLQVYLQPDTDALAVDIYANVGRYRPSVAADGTFKFPALPEGHYSIKVETSGLAVAVDDIRLNGQSVKEKGISVGAAEPGALEIRLRNTPGNR